MALIQGEGAGRPPARGSARTPTPRARLRRAGFADPDRAATLVEELRGSGFDLVGPGGAAGRLDAFGAAADPDAALLSLVRLAETPDAVPFLEEFFADDGGAHHVRCSPGGEPGSLPAGGPGGVPSGGAPDLARRSRAGDGGAHSGGGSEDGGGWARLVAVLGGSVALGDHLIRHPEQLARVLPLPSAPMPVEAARPVAPLPSVPARNPRASRVLAPNKAPSQPKVMTPETSAAEGPASDAGGDHPASGGDHPAPGGAPAWDAAPIGRTRAEVCAALLAAVGADPAADQPAASDGGAAAVDALRVAYRARLIEIAAADLAAPDPLAVFPEVGAALADLATGTLEAALAVARARTPGSE
ncbi:MAG: hypothetical protein LBM66_02445, partial [Bifidobacteriaceae bacterium]|nr:hypothetical protein [Bifidobacteriaceae bacterium]